MEALAPLQLNEEEKQDLRSELAQFKQRWANEYDRQGETINLRLEQLKGRLDRLTDAYLDRVIAEDIFEERKSRLLIERRALEEKLAEVRSGKRSVPDELTNLLELANGLSPAYKLGSLEQKRELLRIATSNRSVDGKKLEIMLALPFQTLANRSTISYGGPTGS